QAGVPAMASFVRQMPPPAAATHSRQGAPAGAEALPQFGSMASAGKRPDSTVDGPVWVSGSKNWPDSPGMSVLTGPSADHAPGAAVSVAWYACESGAELNAGRSSLPGLS